MGSTMMMGPADITGFRASAATAQYSRVLAEAMYAEMYGDTNGEHRPYGYVTGGSGGAYKTMACYENAPGVWDGAVPFIHGSHVSMPNVFTVQAHAFRVLEDVFDQIVDAVEPGGGDMYAGLDEEQRAALEEITRMGFPPAPGSPTNGSRCRTPGCSRRSSARWRWAIRGTSRTSGPCRAISEPTRRSRCSRRASSPRRP